jgi:hypothetical protein
MILLTPIISLDQYHVIPIAVCSGFAGRQNRVAEGWKAVEPGSERGLARVL